MTDELQFLETLYTPLISDVMDKLGIGGQVFDHSIQQIFSDPHQKVAGYAFPCRVIPTEEYVEIDNLLKMVDSIRPDSIVAVAADSDIDAALWGGMMSARARSRGARAAVVNGGVRDLEQIAELGFAVYGTYRCIKDIRKRGYMAEFDTEITIGGVRLSPNDIIVGDANGVLAIPSVHKEKVLAALIETRRNEELTMKGLQQGSSAKALFEQYKTF